MGLETATSGTIEIADVDASDYAALSDGKRKRLRQAIQIVFQDPYYIL